MGAQPPRKILAVAARALRLNENVQAAKCRLHRYVQCCLRQPTDTLSVCRLCPRATLFLAMPEVIRIGGGFPTSCSLRV